MRLLFTTALLLFLGALGVQAQTDVVSVPQIAQGMTLDGDDLYISAGAKIYKVDFSVDTPKAVVLMEGLNYMSALSISGTDLYMGNFDKIYKVDLTASPLVATELLTDLRYVADFLLDGNDMYFAEQNGSKISKFDVTESMPTVTEVISGIGAPTRMTKVGDTLYVTRYGVSRVSKIDVTASPVVSVDVVTTDEAPSGIAAVGNYVFYSEFNGDEGGQGKISKIDITQANPTPEVLVSGFDQSWDMVIYGCDLFYTDASERKVKGLSVVEDAMDLSTTAEWKTVTSSQNGATYQWIDCADNSPITDETDKSFTATENGEYAVVVTVGACSDTSECVSVISVGADETPMLKAVSIYPNPSNGMVNMDLGTLENVAINVFDTRGQLIHSQSGIITSSYQLNLNGATPGVYIVELNAHNARQQYKLMVK